MITGRLNVWGLNIFHGHAQRRAVVATRTKAEAARAFDVPMNHLSNYGAITGNDYEIAVATRQPGTVFVHLADSSAPAEFGEWVAL